MSTTPRAQYVEDPEAVVYHGHPPPTYDQAMGLGHHMQYAPQSVHAPYPPHNCK
jgi:hypothetical protein